MGLNKPHLRYKDQTPRERTWTIHFISVMKFVKGVILVVVGVKLLTLLGRDVEAWATDFVTRHGIDLANKYVHSALEKLQGVGNTQLMQMSGVAFGYSALLFTEGVGLWLQKRWAEFLTAIATGLLIPLEIYEIYEKFTWVRVAILILNLFIVWYLVTRLKDEKVEAKVRRIPKTNEADPWIKICGITNLEDALMAVRLGANVLGFNFYQNSSRYISPESASSIQKQLPKGVSCVGVFVNEELDTVTNISRAVGLDAIQLHGDEKADFVKRIRILTDLDVIKVIRVGPGFRVEDTDSFGTNIVLLDSLSPKEWGGTGTSFDWKIAYEVQSRGLFVYLAGGLSPDNISQAIRVARPHGVDVCSGVESEPGKKDENKLRRFIEAVRETA